MTCECINLNLNDLIQINEGIKAVITECIDCHKLYYVDFLNKKSLIQKKPENLKNRFCSCPKCKEAINLQNANFNPLRLENNHSSEPIGGLRTYLIACQCNALITCYADNQFNIRGTELITHVNAKLYLQSFN